MHLGNVIIDVNGIELTPEECEILRHPAVAGVILFARNFESKKQLCALTEHIKKIRSPLIICIDQEGGRVQRLPLTFLKAMSEWGKDYQANREKTVTTFQQSIRILCQELKELGIAFNLAPVLDLNHGVSEIIGERSFHKDPNIIIELAEILIDCVHAADMPVTAKHFPGHGAVVADSHLELPHDTRDLKVLWETDIKPYFKLAKQLDSVMTAHIVYPAVDHLPATYSRFWLKNILRERCRFDGAIISDDLAMAGAALIPNPEDRATQALEAGCDLLIACNQRNASIKMLETLENYKNLDTRGRIDRYVYRTL
jgi:beta-N-acetylhexosaminidase